MRSVRSACDRAVVSEPAPGSAAPELSMASGRIEIVLSGGVRVKIEGAVDPVAVTAAVAAVMKARRRQ